MRLPLLAGALAALLPLAPAAAQDADTVLARVGETEITLGHVVALRARLLAQEPQYEQIPDADFLEGALVQLIQQQVLADAAAGEMTRADAVGLENERRAFLAGRLIARELERPVADEEVAALHAEMFGSAEPVIEWNASHILVATEPEARRVLAELNDGADFAELAEQRSTGPSGPRGGALGWFGPGMMVPEFEQAVQGLEPGGLSEPVETQFGWHVVRLNERRDRAAPPLEQVRPQVEQALRERRAQALIERLTAEAGVERTGAEVNPALIRDPSLLD